MAWMAWQMLLLLLLQSRTHERSPQFQGAYTSWKPSIQPAVKTLCRHEVGWMRVLSAVRIGMGEG